MSLTKVFVICHGSLLSTDSAYVHKNRSVRGFGGYGDVLLRDRKMYVPPTPYALLEGVDGRATLVAPAGSADAPPELVEVGQFVRHEAATRLKSYEFDLDDNTLRSRFVAVDEPGSSAFVAYRIRGDDLAAVSLRQAPIRESVEDDAD